MDIYQGEQNSVRQNSLPIEVVEGGMGGTCDTKHSGSWNGEEKVGASKRCEARRLSSCSGLATSGTPGMGRRPVGASERVRRADNQVALVVVTRGSDVGRDVGASGM